MDSSVWFDTIHLKLSIAYIEGSQVIISQKNIVFISLKIDFVIANSEEADEMPHNVAFHQGLHCFPECPFRGFQSNQQRIKLV